MFYSETIRLAITYDHYHYQFNTGPPSVGSCIGTPESVRQVFTWGPIDAPQGELSSESTKVEGAEGASEVEAVITVNGRSAIVSTREDIALTGASWE